MSTFSELDLLSRFPFERNSGNVLIDVGAHVGTFSKRFAAKGWTIVAFEPEERNYAGLRRTLEPFPNVTYINKAVSNVSGEEVTLYESEEHFGIHSLKPFHATHRPGHIVETIRLDDALKELQVPAVSLLKIDIEGADYLALQSFDFELYHPELIMVEFMDERSQPNFDYSYRDMVEFMEDKGFRSYVSEWAPIKEYGRQGVKGESHEWIQCAQFPLDHSPAWGNLIFVPRRNGEKFEALLQGYLAQLAREEQPQTKIYQLKKRISRTIKAIPGAAVLYRTLRQTSRKP